MRRFDAVVFDLFETLVTEFDPGWRPGPTTADRLGVPNEVFNTVWRARHTDRMTSSVDFRDVLREVCSAADCRVDATVARTIQDLYDERLAAKAMPLKTVEPRLIGALQQLRQSGLRLAVLSNCSIEEIAAWDDSPLADLIDAAVFSWQLGIAKPEPAAFHNVCRAVGAAPHRVAFVGDGGSNELFGATAAGLTALRARWFLDRWPAARQRHALDRAPLCPEILQPEDLPAIVLDTTQPR